MRREGGQQFDKVDQLVPADLADFVDIIDQAHQAGDRGVELLVLDIRRDLLDGLVDRCLQFFHILILYQIDQSADTVQEPAAALDGLVIPGSG